MAGKPRIQLDFDKVYTSNSCGQFKIIQDLGRDEKSKLYVRVKFLETGTEVDTRYDKILEGKVMDELYGIDFNKIYNSYYYGPFKIISYVGRNHESKKIVRVKFLNTGYEYDVLLRQAKNGDVKDYSVPFEDRTINSEIDPISNLVHILRGRWKGMMDRCYKPNSVNYANYGAIGVTVCEYWHNVDNFIASSSYIPNYYKFSHDPVNYHLDKDYLQLNVPKEKRVYSPQTCVFLSVYDNSNLKILENHRGYFGVRGLSNGTFAVEFSVNGEKKIYGIYSNKIAALNEYNYYYIRYSLFEYVPLLNEGMEYMSHEEAQKYLIR